MQCGKPDTGSASDVRRGSMMHTCGSCLAKESSARCEPLSGSCMAGMHKKGIFSFFCHIDAKPSGFMAGGTCVEKIGLCHRHSKAHCLLASQGGVYTRTSASLTISLLSIVSDITQSIRTVRIKPHQARQQRLGGPHTHACQSRWTSHRLLNAACHAT